VDEIIPTALTLVPTGTETDPGEHVRNFAQTEPITLISAEESVHAPVEVIRSRNSVLADYVSYRDQTGPDPRTAALDGGRQPLSDQRGRGPYGGKARLRHLSARLRYQGRVTRRSPRVRILLRADSGFAREELMRWCEWNAVDYVFGLAKNHCLNEVIAVEPSNWSKPAN